MLAANRIGVRFYHHDWVLGPGQVRKAKATSWAGLSGRFSNVGIALSTSDLLTIHSQSPVSKKTGCRVGWGRPRLTYLNDSHVLAKHKTESFVRSEREKAAQVSGRRREHNLREDRLMKGGERCREEQERLRFEVAPHDVEWALVGSEDRRIIPYGNLLSQRSPHLCPVFGGK